ncbi:leucine-rich repeat domain-containing protein [Mangrovimonas cancribranchiae]|uniref:T9SS type A sorting domain-containing protein n=1 Tax=Mangrovimonas cancribranchiae TaxID=3080055 RepID=A0AAU6PAN5_9FLAO
MYLFNNKLKKCIIILWLVIGGGVFAQTTLIPDSNFEQALINIGIDTNGLNGNILNSDAITVEYLNLDHSFISDLSGIEAFSNLKYLFCFGNNISNVNLSQNTELKKLDLQENSLLSLNVSNNTKLRELYVNSNILSSLDVTNNPSLKILECSLNNLSNLNVTQNHNLERLNCYSNNLSSLNITSNIELKSLTTTFNPIGNLDVSSNTQLEFLSCGSNDLSSLSLVNNVMLKYIDCSNNTITALDISSSHNLERLFCSNNNINALDFSNANDLITSYADNNNISFLDFSNCSNVRRLRFNNNTLSNVDLRNQNNHNIVELEMLQNTNLSCIYVDDTSASYLQDWSVGSSCHFVENETECNALSVEQEKLDNISSLQIFPNPTKGKITIKTEFAINGKLTVYTLNGQTVFSTDLQNINSQEIYLGNLQSGIYMLKLFSHQENITQKLVIK